MIGLRLIGVVIAVGMTQSAMAEDAPAARLVADERPAASARLVPPAAIPVAPGVTTEGPQKFRSIEDAFKSGIRANNAGDKRSAVDALSYAAENGYAPAAWKLARMYASGDGVPANQLRAFQHFESVADTYAEEQPDSPNAPFAANAFVALGEYYLKGIANTRVKANPVLARRYFNHAAIHFGDPDGQYSLGRMWREGLGGSVDKLQAARLFNLAAQRCHRGAQAVLGHMLFNADGVPRQAGYGLALLESAREGFGDHAPEWVVDMHEEVSKVAKDRDKQAARVLASKIVCPRG